VHVMNSVTTWAMGVIHAMCQRFLLIHLEVATKELCRPCPKDVAHNLAPVRRCAMIWRVVNVGL
jgi:hypothetical protein